MLGQQKKGRDALARFFASLAEAQDHNNRKALKELRDRSAAFVTEIIHSPRPPEYMEPASERNDGNRLP